MPLFLDPVTMKPESDGYLRGEENFQSTCSVTSTDQALFLGRNDDVSGTTATDHSGSGNDATIKQNHCLTLATNDTITIDGTDDRFPNSTTISSNGGTAVLSITDNVITCTTGGTVFDLQLSNGSVFPCAEGFGSSIFDSVNHFEGVLSANDWTATQPTYAYNVSNSFGNYVTDWGDFNGPIAGHALDTAGGTIYLDFTNRRNSSANQFVLGSISSGRFDMAINTSHELSFVFRQTPAAYSGISLKELEKVSIKIEWTATVVELFVNGVSQGQVTKTGGSFPSGSIWLGNRINSTSNRLRGEISRYDYYDSSGQLQYSSNHQSTVKLSRKLPTYSEILLFPEFGQSLSVGTGTVSESTFRPVQSFHCYDGRKLVPLQDPMTPLDGGLNSTPAGSMWPRFFVKLEENGHHSALLRTARSSTPVVQISGDSQYFNVGGDAYNRFNTMLTECVQRLTAQGYRVRIPMIIVNNGQNETGRLHDGASNKINPGDYQSAQQNVIDTITTRYSDNGTAAFGIIENGQQDPNLSSIPTINDDAATIRSEQRALVSANSNVYTLDTSGETVYDDGYLADVVHRNQAGYHVMGENSGTSFNAIFAETPGMGLLFEPGVVHDSTVGFCNCESVIDFNASAPAQSDHSFGDTRSCPSPVTRNSKRTVETAFFSGS